MTFRYKKQRRTLIETRVPPPVTDAQTQVLSGYVKGKKASALEERYARSLDKYGVIYKYQMVITPQGTLSEVRSNLPGEKQIDFLIERGGLPVQPVLIDGEIAHYHTKAQEVQDELDTAEINNFFEAQGVRPAIRIPFTDLMTDEQVDLKAKETGLL